MKQCPQRHKRPKTLEKQCKKDTKLSCLLVAFVDPKVAEDVSMWIKT